MSAKQLHNQWRGNGVRVNVMYSVAGVATTIIVEFDKFYLMLDAGDGALRDLVKNNYDPHRLRAVLLSHGHYDHVGALWAILGFLRMLGRKNDLYIIAPRGCAETNILISSFLNTYKDTTPFNVHRIEMADGQCTILGNIAISAFSTLHGGAIKTEVLGRIPSIGYIIEFEGQKIVYTGDTGRCASVAAAIKGAELAIIEATWATTERKTVNYHLTIDEAKDLGKLAKNYMLIHRQD